MPRAPAPKTCFACGQEYRGKGGFRKLCDECSLTVKWCPRCESLQPLDGFAPNGRAKGYCQPCHAEYNRERNALPSEREYHAAHHLKHKFGISMEEAVRLRAIDRCEICDAPPAPDDRLHVDHDHSTGEIRGVLCRWCNYAVAMLEDDRLAPVSSYLREAAKRRLTVVR